MVKSKAKKPNIFFLLKKKASLSEESEKTRDVTREQRACCPAARVVAPGSVSHPDSKRERVAFWGTGVFLDGLSSITMEQPITYNVVESISSVSLICVSRVRIYSDERQDPTIRRVRGEEG